MLFSRDIAQARIGAQVDAHGVSYRVWAPEQRDIEVIVERTGGVRRVPLNPDSDGFWSALDVEGRAGDLYRYKLLGERLLPDVASRFQPEGVHGRSECIDPLSYPWQCTTWKRPGWRGQTTYEIHIGTLTMAGTFRAAISKLEQIRNLGVEAIEIMPVADFNGERNWGYDGVDLFAPARCYGRPDDLRALVDAAHQCGLAVILDVVYNHVGPDGNYLGEYCPYYFRNDQHTPWGRTFNLDGAQSGPVRDFLRSNAAYWLDEFRLDGLRLDATHAIVDNSSRHLLEEIAATAHERGCFLIAEDERNTREILRPSDGGGLGIDAAWADDFHHQVRVALTGTQKSYFAGYKGGLEDIADTLEHGWTYRGQPYPAWKGRPRGTSAAGLGADALVYCIENHDQIGNRALGERLEHLVDPGQFRAASMLLCLGPYPILIFMGQEWAATTPFLFFCNHGGELGRQILAGRRREFDETEIAGEFQVPNPEDLSSFVRSKLCWEERGEGVHAVTLEFYRACLRERRSLFAAGPPARESWSVHTSGAFLAIRYRLDSGERMLLLTFRVESMSEAGLPESLRPPPGSVWRVVLDGRFPRHGGTKWGEQRPGWRLKGPNALWLEAQRGEADHVAQ